MQMRNISDIHGKVIAASDGYVGHVKMISTLMT